MAHGPWPHDFLGRGPLRARRWFAARARPALQIPFAAALRSLAVFFSQLQESELVLPSIHSSPDFASSCCRTNHFTTPYPPHTRHERMGPRRLTKCSTLLLPKALSVMRQLTCLSPESPLILGKQGIAAIIRARSSVPRVSRARPISFKAAA